MTPSLDPEVARAAALWFSRATSGEFAESDRAAWLAWRRSDPAHEQAWAQVEAISQRFGLLLPAAGMAALARPRPEARRRALRAIAALGVTGGAGWLAWEQAPWRGEPGRYQTATGERRSLTLEDGTALMLNTATEVAVHIDGQLRRVTLRRGEIQVRTARDPQQRPFVVATRFGELRPIGTRFVVRQEDEAVQLTVLEGAVRAQHTPAAATPPVRVDAGRSVRLDRHGVGPVQPAPESADAWTQGLLMADGMRLADFTAELSRYRPGLLSCDPAVGALRLSGAFPLDDTDRALAAATRALPVRVHRLTRWWVRIGPA
ncbi:FecR domain-containing protein [Pseudacidovorax intermedius]|uniref:FecR domain-containing protein n=1 Tax=Pseudacidovorax intermedius TaxID=433924 RepID=UPI0026F28B77|nr:FecR domain-containing protein [Pseudacidovorax intermedius]